MQEGEQEHFRIVAREIRSGCAFVANSCVASSHVWKAQFERCPANLTRRQQNMWIVKTAVSLVLRKNSGESPVTEAAVIECINKIKAT